MRNAIPKSFKILLISFFIFSLSGVVMPETVLAQTITCPTGQAPININDGLGSQTCVPNPNGKTSAQLQKEFDAAAAGKSGGSECSWTNIYRCIVNGILFVPGWAAVLILQLSHLIVWIAGAALNYSVQYSVVDMKMHLDEAGAVNEAWQTIRDVANMAFIFVLLYAAIQTIIGVGKDNQKLIVRVVLVAILINFSLFFTKFVIDISNVLAMTFYDAIAPGALVDPTANIGIANSLMEPLHLQSIMNTVGIDPQRLLMIGVLGTIFALVAAFVFFAIALMFLIRFVLLVFVLVLSPIAFIAFILPQAEKYRTQWVDTLIGQAFFAPIYFLLTWVVIVISRGMLTNTGNWSEIAGAIAADGTATAPSFTAVGILVKFIIMIVLLIASLIIAKEWANKAPNGVSKLTSWATGAAGGAAFGLTGRIGRRTLGAAGQALADSDWAKRNAPDSRVARLALATGKKMGSSSYDFRATKAGGATLGQADAGAAGGKGGFLQDREDKVKRRMDEASRLTATVTGADVERVMAEQGYSKEENRRLGRTAAEVEARRRQVQGQLVAQAKNTTTERQERYLHDISQTRGVTPNLYSSVSEDAEAARRLREEKGPAMQARARFEQVSGNVVNAATPADLERALANITDKDLEAIVESNRDLLARLDFANALSAKQLESLNKNEKFSEAEREGLLNLRFGDINAAMAAGGAIPPAISTRIKDLTVTELELINPAHLVNPVFANEMKPDQVDGVQKSNKFTASQKTGMRNARNQPLNNAFGAGGAPNYPEAIRIMSNMRPEALVQLDQARLADTNILTIYRPALLNKMAARPELTEAKATAIREAIINAATAPGTTPPPELTEAANWLLGDGLKIF